MRTSIGPLLLLIITFYVVAPIGASMEESFLRKMKAGADSIRLQKSLLEVATPLSDLGKDVVDTIHRRMDSEDENGGDDYFMESTYDFQDYSLKYATCQKIQRFSSEAVSSGEYSAMVVDDIVVLRLCPKRYCSSNSQWGCNNGYGEYALRLDEYLKIMLQYKSDKRNNLCTFCAACGNRRKMEDAADNDDAYANDNGDDAADEGQVADDFYAYADDDNGNQAVIDDYYNEAQAGDENAQDSNGDNYYKNMCDKYATVCQNAYNKCNNQNNGMTYLDYLNYMGCVGVQSEKNGNYYWLSPHCDSSSDKISMGIFSDPYCSQYAGDSVNINNYAGVNFDNSIFNEFYKDDCIDCTTSYTGPYYNSNNYMCNNIFQRSGQCNTYLAYSVSDGNDQATSEVNCAFIESIRYGTYDGNGQLYVSGYSSTDVGSYQQTVTPFQTGALVVLSSVCLFLALYSCVLHHEITNALLKSFNIGLVTPHNMKSRKGSSRSRRSRSRRGVAESDSDYRSENKVGDIL